MFRLLTILLVASITATAGLVPTPRVFVKNAGQWPSQVLYGATTPAMSVWITQTGMILDQLGTDASGVSRHHAVTLNVVGSRGSMVTDVVSTPATTPVYYPSAHNPNLESHSADAVTVRNMLPGLHIEYVWDGNLVRYNILVDKGATLPTPLFRVSGAQDLQQTHDGFSYRTSLGSVSMSGLAAYSGSSDKMRQVKPLATKNGIGFVVSDRALDESVVVDPIVSATSIRGSKTEEITSMKIDGQGNVVIAGWTTSFDITIPSGGANTTGKTGTDGFVACLTKDLKTIIAWTYIAGDSNETVRGLSISTTGDIWVTGETNSNNLPVTVLKGGAYSGTIDGFVFKLSSDLKKILAGRYIPGNREDRPRGIVCTSQGGAVICGQTLSTSGMSTALGHDATHNGGWDGFVLVLAPNGTDAENFSYFGGTLNDGFVSATFDNSGNIYFAGWTTSPDVEMLPKKTREWVPDSNIYPDYGYWKEVGTNSYDIDFAGGTSDVLVVKFTYDLNLSFSTYYGGKGDDMPAAILMDNDGRVFVIGSTTSSDLPIPTEGSSTYGGKSDAFVCAISSDGVRLRSSMYYGGNGDEFAADGQFTPTKDIAITGNTTSSNILQLGEGTTSEIRGKEDGFFAILASTELKYSSTYGWNGSDIPNALVRDAQGSYFIAGRTTSDLPSSSASGASDGFIVKWAFGTLTFRTPASGTLMCTGTAYTITWTTSDLASDVTYNVGYSVDNGVTWNTVAKDLRSKTYTWNIPADLPTSPNLLLRVVSSLGHTASGSTPYVLESAPSFVTQPSSGTFCTGRSIVLDPNVAGGSLTYQWYKNGNVLNGATQRTLTIPTATASDAGQYHLTATTQCSMVQSTDAAVAVVAQPQITTQPISRSVAPNSTATLEVVAVGEALTYQWEKDAVAIGGATMSAYVINGITPAQAGVYRCLVGSACGNTTSNEAILTVGPTSVDDGVSPTSVFNATPQPATDVLRLTFGTELATSAVATIRAMSGVEVLRISLPANTTTVETRLTSIPAGVYTVIVTNGNTTMRAMITILK